MGLDHLSPSCVGYSRLIGRNCGKAGLRRTVIIRYSHGDEPQHEQRLPVRTGLTRRLTFGDQGHTNVIEIDRARIKGCVKREATYLCAEI